MQTTQQLQVLLQRNNNTLLTRKADNNVAYTFTHMTRSKIRAQDLVLHYASTRSVRGGISVVVFNCTDALQQAIAVQLTSEMLAARDANVF